jgi:adhesin transport system outer membrane protein
VGKENSVMNKFLKIVLLSTVSLLGAGGANAMGLKEAVQLAMDSNPEIGQAIQNNYSTGF